MKSSLIQSLIPESKFKSEPSVESTKVSEQLQRSSSLLSPDSLKHIIAGCEPGPNIYELLSESSSKISLSIAPTLIKINDNAPTILSTNSSGHVELISNPHAFSQYLDSIQKQSRSPKFIFKEGKNKSEVCNSCREAIYKWTMSNSLFKMIQLYVVPQKKRPNKLRVHWSNAEGLAGFFIRKKSVIPSSTGKKSGDNDNFQKYQVYQYKMSEFPHAGKLYKSSFSINCIYKPSLHSSKPVKELSKPSVNSEDFLIRFEEGDYEFDGLEWGSEIEAMTNQVALLINKNLSELVCDFTLSKNEKWNFLSCKCYKVDEVKKNPFLRRDGILPRFNDISILLRQQLTILPALDIDDLKYRLQRIDSKNKDFKKKASQPILKSPDWVYTPTSVVEVQTAEPCSDLFTQSIAQAAEKIDFFRGKANRTKRLYAENLELNKSKDLYHSFLSKLFDKLDEDSSFYEPSRKIEKSIQYWGYSNIKDLAYILRYITVTMNFDPYKFKQFLVIASQVCEELNLSSHDSDVIHSVIVNAQTDK